MPSNRYAAGQAGDRLDRQVRRILHRWNRYQADDPRELARLNGQQLKSRHEQQR